MTLEMDVSVDAVEEDRLELVAEADIDARELGMSWSPVGTLRTPVTSACAGVFGG